MLLDRRTLMLAGAASLAGSYLPARAADTIHFATLPAMDFMVPLLAQDAGLFKKRNLDVEMQISAQPTSLLPAVIGGSIQFGISTGIQVSLANEAGLDAVIVAGGDALTRDHITTAIVVRPDSTLQKPEDFIGKKVVVPGINGAYYVLFLRYLKQGGVDPQRVDMVEGGFSQMPDMLRGKQADAVLSAEPFLTRMVDSGAGKRLDYFIPDREYVITAFFIAKRSWVDSHRSELEQVRAAMRDAIALTKSDPAATNAIITSRLKLPPDVMAKQKPAEWRVDVRPEDVQFWVDLAVQTGLLKERIDAAKLLA